MMILVDTSVWIEFFKANDEFYFPLKQLIENACVLTVECIFAELLQGVKTQKEESTVMAYWNCLPKVDSVGLWLEAGKHSSRYRLYSKGVGLIDVLILIAARNHQAQIWSLDKKLVSVLKKQEIFIPSLN